MNIRKVMIAGGGTLGSQIAWQTAFKGIDVVVYDAFEAGLEAAGASHAQFSEVFVHKLGATQAAVDQAQARITYSTDLGTAVLQADLVSESIPEDPKIKTAFYRELSQVASPQTIFTTNSSTLLPSDFVSAVLDPARFLALHFANVIWKFNVAEVMAHPGTDPAVQEQVVRFARAIGMVPIVLQKEQNGYVLNSILGPMLSSALELVEKGVATCEAVDKTWRVAGNPRGPFMMMDVIGLETVYAIEKYWGEKLDNKQKKANALYIKTQYLDLGKLGLKTGEGFYTYPNPAYKDPDFLT